MIMELNTRERMEKCLQSLVSDFSSISAGRAHPHLLSNLFVEYYGKKTPLEQVCSITVQDSTTLVLNVWDKSVVRAIANELAAFGMGFNPAIQGAVIKVPIPPLSEERRQDLVKVTRRQAEAARVAVRNVRRDSMQRIREQAKEKVVNKDEVKVIEAEVQKLTNEHIGKVDELLKKKEKELIEI